MTTEQQAASVMGAGQPAQPAALFEEASLDRTHWPRLALPGPTPPRTFRTHWPRLALPHGVPAAPEGRPSPEPWGSRRIPQKLFLTSQYASLDACPAELRANVQRTLDLNPGIAVTWFNDEACLNFLNATGDPRLPQVFKRARFGKFRSDLCRSAYLAKEGGFYLDLDVQMAVPLERLAAPGTTFLSAWAGREVLNALIGVRPGSPILQRTVEAMAGTRDDPGALLQMGTRWWGPEMLQKGLEEFAQTCGKYPPAAGHDLAACGEEIRMFKEVDMRKPAGLPLVVVEEAQSARPFARFEGGHYAILYPGPEPFLAGFSRFDGCSSWGCGQGKWSLAQRKVLRARRTRRPASP